MKNPIILFPIKPTLSGEMLKKLPKSKVGIYNRYSLIISFDQEDEHKASVKVASCSPFDRFERKKGYAIAQTKVPYVLQKDSTHEWKDVIDFIEYVAVSGMPLEKVLESMKDSSGIVQLIQD